MLYKLYHRNSLYFLDVYNEIESHIIYSKRPNTPNFKYISPPEPKLRSQRSNINFWSPKSTLRGQSLTLKGLITKFQKQCRDWPFMGQKTTSICPKLTLICQKSTQRGSKIVSQMPRIDSHRPKIDSQNAKSNPDGSNLTARGQNATPVSPKTDSQMPKIEYTSNKVAKSRLQSHKFTLRGLIRHILNIYFTLKAQTQIAEGQNQLFVFKIYLQRPKFYPQMPNNDFQSSQLDSYTSKIDFQRPQIQKMLKLGVHRSQTSFHMPVIDSHMPKIDSQRFKKCLPDAQNWLK